MTLTVTPFERWQELNSKFVSQKLEPYNCAIGAILCLGNTLGLAGIVICAVIRSGAPNPCVAPISPRDIFDCKNSETTPATATPPQYNVAYAMGACGSLLFLTNAAVCALHLYKNQLQTAYNREASDRLVQEIQGISSFQEFKTRFIDTHLIEELMKRGFISKENGEKAKEAAAPILTKYPPLLSKKHIPLEEVPALLNLIKADLPLFKDDASKKV